MYHLEPVGVVRNRCKDVDKVSRTKDEESVIEVDERFADGLFMIETCDYVDILFYFHQLKGSDDLQGLVDLQESDDLQGLDDLQGPDVRRKPKEFPLCHKIITGEKRGVFASRSPRRPSPIGVTTVRLLGRDGNRLRVTGLDAVDGTPVLDIKACDTSQFEKIEGGREQEIHRSIMKSNPRISIWKQIMANDTEKLLLHAGQMHGHYCPGLAMGVMAAVRAMQQIQADSDGLEDLLAIVETNNCLADGVQVVTGCSFGNNSLIFHDIGKTAFTLTRRDGNGIRIISRHESQEYIRASFPDFDERYKRVVVEQNRDPHEIAAYKKSGIERAFGTLKLDFDRLFDMQSVKVDIPEYAPSHDSKVCSRCGESVMSSRVVVSGKHTLCLICSDEKISILDGHGIRTDRPGIRTNKPGS